MGHKDFWPEIAQTDHYAMNTIIIQPPDHIHHRKQLASLYIPLSCFLLRQLQLLAEHRHPTCINPDLTSNRRPNTDTYDLHRADNIHRNPPTD